MVQTAASLNSQSWKQNCKFFSAFTALFFVVVVFWVVTNRVGAADTVPAGERVDWEEGLARADLAHNRFKKNQSWYARVRGRIENDPALQRKWKARWRKFVRRHPGTRFAAEAEIDEIRRFDKDDLQVDPAELKARVDWLKGFLRRYSDYVSLRKDALRRLSRIIRGRDDLSDEERLAFFEVMLPYLAHYPRYLARGTRGFVRQLDVSEEKRYRLARRGARAAGANSGSREYLAGFLKRYVRFKGTRTEKAIEACEDFLNFYGEDTPESRNVLSLKLQKSAEAGSTAAKAKLERLRAQAAHTQQRLDPIFKKANASLDRGDVAGAVAALKGADLTPRHAAQSHWLKLLRHEELGSAPPGPLGDLLEYALRQGATGPIGSRAIRHTRHGEHPRELELLTLYFRRHAEDASRFLGGYASPLNRLLRAAAGESDQAKALVAYRAAADALRRTGVKDREAEVLFLAGRTLWWTERRESEGMLARAVKIAPGTQAATRAGWLLSFFQGDLGLTRSPLPRCDIPESSARPKLPELPAPTTESSLFEKTGDGVTPQSRSVDENLVTAGRGRAVQSPKQAEYATDGNAETVWRPESNPAVLIVPLRRLASVRRVRVRATSSLHLCVSLLDVSGRVLSRFARDWGFAWTAGDYYPAETQTFELVPVDDVRYIRIDVTGGQPADGGISEVEVYGTKYPLVAERVGQPVPLPDGAKTLAVQMEADEPEQRVSYAAGLESTLGYVLGKLARGGTPWLEEENPVELRQARRNNLALEFYGDNAELHLSGAGAVEWRILGEAKGRIEHPEGDVAKRLADGLGVGPHHLCLHNRSLPTTKDERGQANSRFVRLDVEGRARARGAIRFGRDGEWGRWKGPLRDGMKLQVPDAAERYQLKTVFDNRGVLGRNSATVRTFKVGAVDGPGDGIRNWAVNENRRFVEERLEEAAELVSRRRVVVTYGRAGCRREYRAARRIADKAGLYLVSDDHASLNYRKRWRTPIGEHGSIRGHDGLPLVVGRPLRHRYARQVVAMRGIWRNPDYLNDEEGLVTVVRRPDGSPWYVLAIGETPEAVVAAAERLGRGVKQHEPREPFRVFASDTLEVVYAWQVHPERSRPEELSLRLGVNDRRSLQFGIAAEKELKDLRFEMGELTREDGATLRGRVRIRPTGSYEHGRFFGEVRVPNQLLDKPYLPVPAHTAMGVWVTVRTNEDVQPGEYAGKLTVEGANHVRRIPVRIVVEPVVLPDFGPSTFYGFADVAWWFTQGTSEYDRAIRQLARNVAEHGIQLVSAGMQFDVREMEKKHAPHAYAVADLEVMEPLLEWHDWNTTTRKSVGAKAREAIYIDAGKCHFIRDVIVDAQISSDGSGGEGVKLEYRNQRGRWAPAGVRVSPYPHKKGALLFRVGKRTDMLRLRREAGGNLSIGEVVFFIDETRKWPVTLDFSKWDRFMNLCEDEFEVLDAGPPTFLGRTGEIVGDLARELVGAADGGAAARIFAEQYSSHLAETGRAGRFMLKVSDEPRDFLRWTRQARPYKEGGLRTMTCHSGNYDNIEAGAGIMDPWCPHYSHDVFRPFFQERRKSGDDVWWYICGSPSTRIIAQPYMSLPFYWATARWGFTGGMSYSAHSHSPHSPESSPVPFRYEHGLNHRVMYLPDGTMLDTYRRELESEGIRDNMLIEHIRKLTAQLLQAGRTQAAETIRAEVDAVLDDVVPFRKRYSYRPQEWFAARNKLYNLAVRASTTLN
jgi:hypothetical protein